MVPPRTLRSLYEKTLSLDWILRSGTPCWLAIGWQHPLQVRAITALVLARRGVVITLRRDGAQWDMYDVLHPVPGAECVLITAESPPIDDVPAAVGYVNGLNFLRDRLIDAWDRPLLWLMPRRWFDEGHRWAYDTWSALALEMPLPPLNLAPLNAQSKLERPTSVTTDVATRAVQLARRLRAEGRSSDARAVLLSIAAPSYLATGREPLARLALALARGGQDELPSAEPVLAAAAPHFESLIAEAGPRAVLDVASAVVEARASPGIGADVALSSWTDALDDVDLALAASDPALASRELGLAVTFAGPALLAGRTVILLHSDDLATAASAALVARLLEWHLSVSVELRLWTWHLDADGLADPVANMAGLQVARQRLLAEMGPSLVSLGQPPILAEV